MSGVILTDCKIMLGGYNLSGFHNSVTLDYGAEMLDDTVFGTSGTRSNKPGLKTVAFTGDGFWDTTQDEANYNRIGAVRELLTIAPVGNAEGDPAYMVRAVNATYNPLSGEVGQLLTFTMDARSANSPLVRGFVLALGAKAANGTGVGVNIGSALATQKIYSALHVTDVTGTDITVTIESSADSGFGSPTTRLTHTTMTDIGADWQEAVGPFTDTYWRASWTPTGGASTIYVVFGIL